MNATKQAAAHTLDAEYRSQRERIAFLEVSLKRRDDDLRAEMEKSESLRAQVKALREALEPYLTIDARKMASIAKRPYAIGAGTVRERYANTVRALEASKP